MIRKMQFIEDWFEVKKLEDKAYNLRHSAIEDLEKLIQEECPELKVVLHSHYEIPKMSIYSCGPEILEKEKDLFLRMYGGEFQVEDSMELSEKEITDILNIVNNWLLKEIK